MPYRVTENRKTLRDEEARELVTLAVVSEYRKGHGIRTVAASQGLSYGTVINLLREAGEPLRKPGTRVKA